MSANVLTLCTLSYTWISGHQIISIIPNKSCFGQYISFHLQVKCQKTTIELVSEMIYSRAGETTARGIHCCPSIFMSLDLPTFLQYEEHVYTQTHT